MLNTNYLFSLFNYWTYGKQKTIKQWMNFKIYKMSDKY